MPSTRRRPSACCSPALRTTGRAWPRPPAPSSTRPSAAAGDGGPPAGLPGGPAAERAARRVRAHGADARAALDPVLRPRRHGRPRGARRVHRRTRPRRPGPARPAGPRDQRTARRTGPGTPGAVPPDDPVGTPVAGTAGRAAGAARRSGGGPARTHPRPGRHGRAAPRGRDGDPPDRPRAALARAAAVARVDRTGTAGAGQHDGGPGVPHAADPLLGPRGSPVPVGADPGRRRPSGRPGGGPGVGVGTLRPCPPPALPVAGGPPRPRPRLDGFLRRRTGAVPSPPTAGALVGAHLADASPAGRRERHVHA